jgi:hypothetical protein
MTSDLRNSPTLRNKGGRQLCFYMKYHNFFPKDEANKAYKACG